jgi:hypothetical protein
MNTAWYHGTEKPVKLIGPKELAVMPHIYPSVK